MHRAVKPAVAFFASLALLAGAFAAGRAAERRSLVGALLAQQAARGAKLSQTETEAYHGCIDSLVRAGTKNARYRRKFGELEKGKP